MDPAPRRPAGTRRPGRGAPGGGRRGRPDGVRRRGGGPVRPGPPARHRRRPHPGPPRPAHPGREGRRPGRSGALRADGRGAREPDRTRGRTGRRRSARPGGRHRRTPGAHPRLHPADERGLTFCGLITLRDALAPTAADTLRNLTDRGVTVKILTGDHPGTAARACRDLGIPVTGDAVLTADRIDALTDADLPALARRTTVFARCTPDHKARITQALRTAGHTVGFLGDGVNDLPRCAPPTSASPRATPPT
ncbi:HAD family hydrolase [Streptomyces diastatochromogenes]|nr:HAD family hydrolase [Streptomyces diastatochromogenes]